MRIVDRQLIADIAEWDCINWGRAIQFWDNSHLVEFSDMVGKKVLDIGGRNGGLSLYWALKGAEVDCTDLNIEGFDKAKKLHKEYNVDNLITYKQLDVLDLCNENIYDVITFKSVMGGVGYNDNYANQVKMIRNIYRALKPRGCCIFAENLTGSKLHMWLRQKCRPWGNSWRYVTISEIKDLFAEFSDIDINSYGFLGILGQGKFFDICSRLDRIFDPFMPENCKYIVSCVARK